jgi:hypothetical protein
VGFAIVVVLASVLGCGKTTTESTLRIKGESREVKAIIDRPASITTTGEAPDTATVSFSGRKLVVEKDRVLLDGKEQAKLPPDTKSVEVKMKDGKLTVTADGAAVEVAMESK